MRKKSILIMVISAVLVGSFAAFTVSYISKTNTRNNSFTVASINPVINETFDNIVKEDVYISNSGNSPIYVRVVLFFPQEIKHIIEPSSKNKQMIFL